MKFFKIIKKNTKKHDESDGELESAIIYFKKMK